MLKLTRKSGQTIKLRTPEGRSIVIHLVKLSSSIAILGFDCEREVKVTRGEVQEHEMTTRQHPENEREPSL